jgi:hypothetical protein
MKGNVRYITVVVICIVGAWLPDGVAQASKSTFSISISMPSQVATGSEIPLDITVSNTSDLSIAFDGLSPYGERNFLVTVVNANGNPAEETKYMKAVRGEDQGSGPQIVLGGQRIEKDIAPGKTLNFKAYLDKLFNLGPGVYRITARRPDLQIGHTQFLDKHPKPVANMKAQVQQPNPSPNVPVKAVAESNTVTLTVQ